MPTSGPDPTRIIVVSHRKKLLSVRHYDVSEMTAMTWRCRYRVCLLAGETYLDTRSESSTSCSQIIN
jgi:hypothetical protein